MRMRWIGFSLLAAALCGNAAQADWMTLEQFREELVGVPLCGTPPTGAFTGKTLCAVHLPDGAVVVAGAGIIIRGIWEPDGGRICRRAANDPMERRRCVDYERISEGHYRNSDGVDFCLGPCRAVAETKAPVVESKAPVVETKPPVAEGTTPATEGKTQ